MSIKQAIRQLSEAPYYEIAVWAEVKNNVLYPAIDALVKDKANYALYLQKLHEDLTDLTEKEASNIIRKENKALEEGYALLALKEYVDILFSAVNEALNKVLQEWIGERERLKEELYKQYQLTDFFKRMYMAQLETEKVLLEILIKKMN